jgi:uncharacterized protein with FMN-binding domain
MRRAPIVVAATAAGLAAVLGFHTQKLRTSVLSGAGPTTTTPTTLPPTGSTGTPTTTPGSTQTTVPGSTPTTTSPSSPGTHTALGSDVQYQYGDLELKVTVSGGKITGVQPVVDNAFDPRSAQINSIATPQLVSETLQAQSANINGVSGASFTSQAYVQSLQAALDKLGIK